MCTETTVYFGTTQNAHSFFVVDYQSDALYWLDIIVVLCAVMVSIQSVYIIVINQFNHTVYLELWAYSGQRFLKKYLAIMSVLRDRTLVSRASLQRDDDHILSEMLSKLIGDSKAMMFICS